MDDKISRECFGDYPFGSRVDYTERDCANCIEKQRCKEKTKDYILELIDTHGG